MRAPATTNITWLVDAIVRQTTVLIAQLATAAGARASLAHTANQVFSNLVRELREQGLSNSLIADMFGLSLRTYHNRMRRLAESTTERGRSLWEAVLSFVRESETVRRTDVLAHFSRDDDASVKSVLADLVDSGLVLQGGRGDRVVYRAADPESLEPSNLEAQAVASLVWITIAWWAVPRVVPRMAGRGGSRPVGAPPVGCRRPAREVLRPVVPEEGHRKGARRVKRKCADAPTDRPASARAALRARRSGLASVRPEAVARAEAAVRPKS